MYCGALRKYKDTLTVSFGLFGALITFYRFFYLKEHRGVH